MIKLIIGIILFIVYGGIMMHSIYKDGLELRLTLPKFIIATIGFTVMVKEILILFK